MRIVISRFVAACCSLAFTSSLLAGSPNSCAADLNFDGTVTGLDLATLLGQWGPCSPSLPGPPVGQGGGSAPSPDCPADLNDDGQVNGLDLAILLGAWSADCSPTVTQLAGNVLNQYPFFEYVRAFNQGAGFHVAIDPTRFPQLVGKDCDLYIVAHKTAVQWASDPALIDVTGGAQAVTISGSTIQANTFAISGSESLNGTQGTAIGIGYDAILDGNRNGLLDAADVIDGLQPDDEAGLYVVRDTAAPGPYAVTELTYDVPGWTGPENYDGQNTFFPSDIASLGQLPLITIGLGSGENYQWYDHIGNHMASHGYIVMSYENLTPPGVSTAALTTFLHTQAILDQQGEIGGGVLAGHIDSNRIVWMGQGRGAEGAVIAYNRILDGTYVPIGWSAASIKLISGMAPLNFMGVTGNNPHGVNFHIWTGAADADVNGCASSNIAQTYQVHDRAEGYRQSITLHGVGYGDFYNQPGGGSVASGPCLIGRPRTHQIMRGYLLPLVKVYVDGEVAAKDFLWRQWESFKPIGAPATNPCPPPSGTGVDVVVDLMYRDGPDAGNFMIDDFQANPDTGTSSSGGAVGFDVTNLVEGLADDSNTNFTWMASDPMNGTTLGGTGDDTRIVVFDWSAPASIEFEVIESQRNLSDDAHLSFRAAQAARHPNTIAALEDQTFDVVLRDGSGQTGSINIGAYGGGIEEPYQRTSCGIGTGWANEFETIRIRLSDFLTNGSGLDLANIVAVRFEFAAPGSESSVVGRIGLDEIEITKD